MVTGSMPLEAPARVRADEMAAAIQAADRSRFRPEFLAAIDWAPRLRGPAAAIGRRMARSPARRKAVGSENEKGPTVPPQSLPAEVLKHAEEQLAEYIGPVAGWW